MTIATPTPVPDGAVPAPASSPPPAPPPHITHYTDSFGDTYSFTDEEMGYTPWEIDPDELKDSRNAQFYAQTQKEARRAKAEQEARRRGYRKRTGMEFPTQAPVVFDATEADRSAMEGLDGLHQLSPCCIVPGYVYDSKDELQLIAPVYGYQEAEQFDNDEKLILERSGQQLGRVFTPRPQLGPGTGFTDADRQRLLDTWHQQGWWFSLVDDDCRTNFPHRAGWRTFPCVGLLMELDPACPMAQSQQAYQLQQQQRQERHDYLKHIMDGKGYEGYIKEIEEEKHDPVQFQQRQQQFIKQQNNTSTTTSSSSTS